MGISPIHCSRIFFLSETSPRYKRDKTYIHPTKRCVRNALEKIVVDGDHLYLHCVPGLGSGRTHDQQNVDFIHPVMTPGAECILVLSFETWREV